MWQSLKWSLHSIIPTPLNGHEFNVARCLPRPDVFDAPGFCCTKTWWNPSNKEGELIWLALRLHQNELNCVNYDLETSLIKVRVGRLPKEERRPEHTATVNQTHQDMNVYPTKIMRSTFLASVNSFPLAGDWRNFLFQKYNEECSLQIFSPCRELRIRRQDLQARREHLLQPALRAEVRRRQGHHVPQRGGGWGQAGAGPAPADCAAVPQGEYSSALLPCSVMQSLPRLLLSFLALFLDGGPRGVPRTILMALALALAAFEQFHVELCTCALICILYLSWWQILWRLQLFPSVLRGERNKVDPRGILLPLSVMEHSFFKATGINVGTTKGKLVHVR